MARGSALWIRAGALPVGVPAAPPKSATGLPLIALGAAYALADAPTEDAARWREVISRTGGDLSSAREIPPIVSLYADDVAAPKIADAWRRGPDLHAAVASLQASRAARLVRFAPIDVRDDPRLAVLLAVTSLQQGGAERVVLDLHHELGALGIRARIAALGRPTRVSFPAPADLIDLSASASASFASRLDALGGAAITEGFDLVHAHLLSGEDLARLGRHRVPIAVTVHNARAGWPAGLGDLTREHAALLIACSLDAEADLRAAGLAVPARTAWNGVDVAGLRPSARSRSKGAEFRRARGLDAADAVLLSVANPRPQKRLERLPAVLVAAGEALARRGFGGRAHLVIAGDADPRAEPGASSARALRQAIDDHGVRDRVHLEGSLTDLAPALAAADVLVSVSAHEGLSLAHLEALAADLPLVATDAGGTREIAPGHPAVAVLPADAAAAEIGEAVARFVLGRPESAASLVSQGFSRARMASRYASLYPRVVAAAERRGPGRGLVLVTNNFSTGGAQSSARRLLGALAADGVPVRAVVLEEQPAHPTPGRRALESSGVPVLAIPDGLDPAAGVGLLLDHLDADPPAAVLFWNALAEHKIRIADALLDVPIFDVSPGEMYFASLDRWLARPHPGLPYRDARAYGSRLAGVIVKYEAEAARAALVLGAPVHVIPNGVPLPALPARSARRDGPFVFGTAARLSPQKKLEALLDALREAAPHLPPHELRIAGGPERGAEGHAEVLRDRARGLSVSFVGEVANGGAFLADLDAFAMISEPAGCPNASLEAMAAGLAVVATDVGGASEQIEDGVTGRLVPRDDVAALAAALVDVAGDRGRAQRMGEAGRARAEARFDLARMVAGYRRVCLSGPSSRPPAS